MKDQPIAQPDAPKGARPSVLSLARIARDVSKEHGGARMEVCDEVPGMLEAFGVDDERSHLLISTTGHGVSPPQSGASHFQERRNGYG